jgi:hypothetical protein
LLVDLAGDDRLAALAKPYAGRLELARGRSEGAGVSGMLVRPDGFVAAAQWATAQHQERWAELTPVSADCVPDACPVER